MITLALWLIASVLAGLVVGRAISTAAQDLPACSYDCRQGRDCCCGVTITREAGP